MTVQELIDTLNKVDDKSKDVVWDLDDGVYYRICYTQERDNFVHLV